MYIQCVYQTTTNKVLFVHFMQYIIAYVQELLMCSSCMYSDIELEDKTNTQNKKPNKNTVLCSLCLTSSATGDLPSGHGPRGPGRTHCCYHRWADRI